MDATSESPVGPLVYDEGRGMLICTTCRCGVGGAEVTIAYHLKAAHPHFSTAQRHLITQKWAAINALTPDNEVGLARAQALGYHADLELFQAGLGCGVRGCFFAAKTRETMAKHIIDHHADVKEAKELIRSDVTYQMLFYHGSSRYHVVTAPDNTTSVSNQEWNASTDDVVSMLQVKWNQYEQERRTTLAMVPLEHDARQLSLWDGRTHWPEHFAGHNMRLLVQATELKRQPKDEDHWFTQLVPTVLELVLWCHAGTRRCSIHVLRLMRSVDATLTPKPFRPHLDETVKRDAKLWQRLILYLVRVHQRVVEDPNCRLSPGVIDDLNRVLASSVIEDTKQLSIQLLKVSHLLITESVHDDPLLNPVMHFLAILGYHGETDTWQAAHEYRPTLSRFIYVIRILALEYAAPQDDRTETGNTKVAVEQYWRLHLHDGADTFFTEVQSLRCYAKVLAGDFYVHPTILWASDLRQVQYKGDWIDLDKFRHWYHSLLAQAETMLDDELIFTNAERRQVHDPVHLTDNLTWKVAGDSFCDLEANGLQQGWRQVLKWARTTEEGRRWRELLLRPGGTVKYHASLLRYRQRVEVYAQKLLLLIQFGCPGSRITELTITTYANGMGSLRSFFILRGQVAFITAYNKSQATTERPKIVVRFMAAAVGRLYVAYVAHVLPFLTLLGMAEGDDDWQQRVRQPSFVWQTAGKPWTTDKVSALMAEQTESAVGVRLGAAAWRNVAIGIDQRLLQPQGTTDAEAIANNHALMMGHTKETENHHYAIPVGMLVGTSEKTYDGFEEGSHCWHRFWGLPSTTNIPVADVSTMKGKACAVHDKGFDTVVQRMESLLEAQTESVVTRITSWLPTYQSASSANTPLMLEDEAGYKLSRVNLGAQTSMTFPTEGSHKGSDIKLSRVILDDDSNAGGEPEMPSLKRPRKLIAIDGDEGSPLGQSPSSSTEKRRKCEVDTDERLKEMLTSMLGPDATWRPGQLEAIKTIVGSSADVMIKMPTAAGKSLIVVMTAMLTRDRVTLVVVPFIALRDDARRRYTALGLQSHVYKAGKEDQASVVFVTPESVATGHFRRYLAALVLSGCLVRCFIDECHTFVLDQSFRPDMLTAAQTLARAGIQRVVMSATLPATVVSCLEIMLELGGSKRDYKRIELPVNRPGISYRVVDAPRQTHVAFLQRRIKAVLTKNEKVLICVMAKARGTQIAQELEVPFYSADMDRTRREQIMANFVANRSPVLVTTSGAGTGIDVDGLRDVFHMDGSFGVTDHQQQAGRGGRGGERVNSTVLFDAKYQAGAYFKEHSVTDTRMMPEARLAQDQDRAALEIYLRSALCRRQILSQYLDRLTRSRCQPHENPCDNCMADSKRNTTTASTISWAFQNTIASTPSSADQSNGVIDEPAIPKPSHASQPGNAAKSNLANSSPSSELTYSSSITSPGSINITEYDQVRLGSLDFPLLPGESSMLTRVNLYLKAVEGIDPLETLLLAREKMVELKDSCLFCWMALKPNSLNHAWEDCARMAEQIGLNENVMKAWASALRKTKKWHRRHYLCFLPLSRPFHPSQFPFNKPCENGDMVRDVVRIGLEADDLRVLIARQSRVHRGMRDDQMAELLTKEVDDAGVGCMLIRLFIDIVLFTCLRRESLQRKSGRE